MHLALGIPYFTSLIWKKSAKNDTISRERGHYDNENSVRYRNCIAKLVTDRI